MVHWIVCNVLSWLLWRCLQIQTNQESLCFALFLLLPLLFIFCVHTMPDSFSWRHEKVYYEQRWLGAKQSHFHTSNAVPASVAERTWWLAKFQSLLLNKTLLCVSGFQASLLFIFFHDTTYGTKPITYVCFTFEIGAMQPRFITDFAPPQRFFCVNRSPLWYDFPGGAEAVRYQSMNMAFNQYRNPKVQSTHTVSFVLLLPSCCFCFVFAGENSKKSHLVTVFCRFWSFRALTAAVVILRLLIHFLFELKKMGRIISNSHFLCPSWRALITIKKNIYISRICALQPSTRFKDLSPQLLVRTTRTAII